MPFPIKMIVAFRSKHYFDILNITNGLVLTAACCPKRDFCTDTPLPLPRKFSRLLYCTLFISTGA